MNRVPTTITVISAGNAPKRMSPMTPLPARDARTAGAMSPVPVTVNVPPDCVNVPGANAG